MRDKRSGQPDWRIGEVAATEKGVLAVDELVACGLTRHGISRRAINGRPHLIFRGVYAVGHSAIDFEALCLAAVKAVGGLAVVSHRSAAALWGFLDSPSRGAGIPEITLIGDRRCAHEGIRIHRSTRITRSEIRELRGVPITSPLRTVIDCAAVLTERRLRDVIRRAFASGLATPSALARAVATSGRRRGIGRLRRALAAGAATRSELEDVVHALILDAGFVPPDVNVPLLLDGRRVVPDFRWPAERLVVEADGAAWHDNPIARAEDRERQRLLEPHGERVVRVAWAQAVGRPAATVRRIAAAGAPRIS